MMARNKVQFQKGLSEAQFSVLYGTEDQCREAVMRWRWPSGFVCPVCAGKHHSFVKTRALYQCTACRRQTSLIAGTIFAATKAPLCTWFRAMYHLVSGIWRWVVIRAALHGVRWPPDPVRGARRPSHLRQQP